MEHYIQSLQSYIGWLKHQLIPILAFTAVLIAGYAVIWLIIYSLIKARTEQINKKRTVIHK